ncbi:hypothetical protein [Sphingobacterium hungaricum]|uniref:Uncharacterized protein n=1 Tax=Sphingobacterium hungaricum TaxID=2082723 RepID=A0A928V013_9SPHI|nr:hypothetical protein [Sphingobacterium hungaricum]MBE8713674.1 hypothetical protein [Sphingobacterium hungaricum]
MSNKIGEGKTIILGMPDWFLYIEIKERLESLGFEVIGIPFTSQFTYKNLGSRIKNFLRKNLFNDKTYKNRLKYEVTGREITNTINSISSPLDYALLIRADYYPKEIIQLIKQKAKVLLGYQWDGIERFPAILESTSLFDRFYVFNPHDLNHYEHLLPLTNFFIESNSSSNHTSIDVYYVGSFIRKRMDQLISLGNFFRNQEISSHIHVVTGNQKKLELYKDSSITVTSQYVNYQENLENLHKAKVLVDLLDDVHNGLSFRVFEALGNNKKLITNNKEIRFYDFYRPENIYIIENENFDGLLEFIQSPYVELDQDLVHKYSFDNWIKYVLQISPYQQISLPKIS